MAVDSERIYTVTMAQVYEGQGHFDKAREVYEYLLERDPQRQDLRDALARLETLQAGRADSPAGRLKPLLRQWVSLNMALHHHAGVGRLLADRKRS